MPLIGADLDCNCGRGHNRFGWFWSKEMERMHDAYGGTAADRELPQMLPTPPPPPTLEESVLQLKQQFENRMRKK